MAGEPTPHDLLTNSAVGVFVSLRKINPAGVLQGRRLKSGAINLYWRYTFNGKTDRVLVGQYDPSRPPRSLEPSAGRYSIAAAERAAQDLAAVHSANKANGGYKAALEREAEERRRQQEVLQRQQEAADRAAHYRLDNLLSAYCTHLEGLGRTAFRDAKSMFRLHVTDAWPALAELPAAAITEEHVAQMLHRLFESKKGRTANKLRAYLRAAYEVARRSRTDPKTMKTFAAFGIRHNPVTEVASDPASNLSAKDPLSADELRTYWKQVQSAPGFEGAVLRLHLLTGGQRIEQLVKLKTEDVGTATITLLDGKGRPGKPARRHPLPLLPAAAEALKLIAPKGSYAISTDGGETHLAATTLSKWAKERAGDKIPRFKAKRLRSGIETLLSSAGISKDTRGRLQSHGVGGVQDASYDGHDYLPQKLMALETLYRLLQDSPGTQKPKRETRARRPT